MAYANQWDETFPADSTLANLIGSDIRRLELDIRQRMDDVFTDASGLWSASGPASPVVPSAALKGNVTGKKLTFHWSSFQFFRSDNTAVSIAAHNSQYVEFVTTPTADTYGYLAFPLARVPGVITVTAVDFLFNMVSVSGSTTFAGYLNGCDYLAPTPGTVDIATANSLVAGVQILGLGTLTYALTTAGYDSLRILHQSGSGLNRNCRFYGARVTYNTPDCRSTV